MHVAIRALKVRTGAGKTAASTLRGYVPGRATTTDVHATDQWLVGQALRFVHLRFVDAFAVDELEPVGCGRQSADTDADEVAVDAVGLDPLRQQFLAGQRACNAIAREAM